MTIVSVGGVSSFTRSPSIILLVLCSSIDKKEVVTSGGKGHGCSPSP